MASLFGIECEIIGNNTGRPDCDVELGRIDGLFAIRTNKGFDMSTTTSENIYALLTAAAAANDPADRIYPIFPGFEQTADNGEERTQATAAGTGNTQTLRDAKKGWTWTSWAGLCAYSAIEGFNKQHRNYDFFAVTDTNQLIAIKRGTEAQGLRFSDFFVSPYNERADDAAPNFTMSARIQRTEEWRKSLMVFVPAGGEDLHEIPGLFDAQPNNYQNANPLAVAGTIKIGVTAGCGGGDGSTNLVELYETILEDTDNWVVSNATTKAVITLTSITASSDKSHLVFVMPTTSPYVAGQGVKFQLAGVTILDTAGMPGYEGQSVVVPN